LIRTLRYKNLDFSDFLFTADASLEGWGVVHHDTYRCGPWEDSDDPIDELELTTVLIALQVLPILQPGANLRVYCDNTVAIAYVNHMGGNVARLHYIARQIWDVLEEHDAFLTAVYVPSAANIADKYTRGFAPATKRFFDLEVQLDPSVFRATILSEGPFSPCFDWFASCFNAQLPRFCAWQEGLDGAELIDAFAHDWSSFPGYMFPPFGLIPKVLKKVCDERAKIVIVHPDWPGALWKPLLDSKFPHTKIYRFKKRIGFNTTIIHISFMFGVFFRVDRVPQTPSHDSQPPPVSDEPDVETPHEEVVLECLMGRWGVTNPAAWSTIFASLSKGTQKSYRLIFSKFLRFMRDHEVDIKTVSLSLVFEFLQPLIDAQNAASTIRSYVASLKFYFTLFERLDLVQSRLLDFFSEGAQRQAPIPQQNHWIWDAGVPLRMIRDRPPPSSFLPAAKEAVFLLLMATGMRVDDVFKMGEDFEVFNGTLVIPFIQKRKCKVKGVWTSSARVASYPGNERLCPITALLLYSTYAVFTRVPGEKALFVSSRGQKAAVATLAGWVKDILLEAGIKAPAHSCRSASTSHAFARQMPIDVILSSAGWSSDLVFFRHYQRVPRKTDSAANLLPVM
jgi:site-specific recombinase XerD